MSELRQLLKDAKLELSRGDYEEAIALSKAVLEIDKDNYFAFVFLGKAYSSIEGKGRESVESYTRATQIDAANLLAWKGFFLTLEEHSKRLFPGMLTCSKFFGLCVQYMKLLIEQEQSQVQLINFVKIVKSHYADDINFILPFLEYFLPGTEPFEILGRHLLLPKESLAQLIRLTSLRESQEISRVTTEHRLKLSTQDPLYQSKINSFAWEIYQNSKLDKYYNQLINVVNDDQERASLETQWLEYRLKLLKSMPAEKKQEFFPRVKDMVDGMVVVKHDSLMAWKLYFDWEDFVDLNSLDANLVWEFFQKFPKEPLAMILYLWLNSNLSCYDTSKLSENNKQNSSPAKEADKGQDQTEVEALQEEDDQQEEELGEMLNAQENETSDVFSEEAILVALMDNISKVKNSTLAYRIVSQYYILNKEYEMSLPYIKSGISLVSVNVRDLGANLINTKRELTIALATGYTYVDAPKNHKFALSLFDKILESDPENIQVKLGKAIISIESADWEDAGKLLTDVIAESPDNLEVQSQLAWCKAHLNAFDNAILMLQNVIKNIEGTDQRTMQFRCENMWREAKVHIMKHRFGDQGENMDLINTAFKILISIIKLDSETFAKSYSTLGDIYAYYYRDDVRAYKCYYKSFEMDFTDIRAAKYICEIYTAAGNWNAAAQICERLVKTEAIKMELRSTNWPYRVIGIAYLERQQESESVEWFHSALRVDPNDVESWVALGQAYFACGRVEASTKVFEKAIEIDPLHLYAQYFNSLSLAEMGCFEECIEILKNITQLNPEELAFQVSYSSILVSYAFDLYQQGFLMKGTASAIQAIELLRHISVDFRHSGQDIWLSLSKAIYLFILVESQIETLPLESILEIFGSVESSKITDVDSIDGILYDNILQDSSSDNIAIACKFLVLASKFALVTVDIESVSATVRSSIWCNIGLSELAAYMSLKEDGLRDAAIYSFKKCIKYQTNTFQAWVGLGIATMDVNFRVSQHCLIKAASFAPKDIRTWFNLAILGLKKNDIDFAHEVLTRTQSLSPESTDPWLGIGLIMEQIGKRTESHNVIAHAYSLSKGQSKNVQYFYANSVVQRRVGSGNDEGDIDAMEELNATALGLEQYFKKKPNHAQAIDLAIMILERLQNYKVADTFAAKLTGIFEQKFEESQDEDDIVNYAIIKAQLARIQLGLGEYNKAIESANLSDGIIGDSTAENCKSSQLSNAVCLGLANFFLGNFDETLTHFQNLLNRDKKSSSLVILLSKVLYELGTEDTKSVALQELTEYINEYGFDLTVTLAIAAITVVENVPENMKVILEELRLISLKDILQDKQRNVPHLIKLLSEKLNIDGDGLETKVVSQRMAYFFPNSGKSWEGIDANIQQRVISGGQNRVTAETLSMAQYSLGNLRSIQRSVFLCPWNRTALASLRECF